MESFLGQGGLFEKKDSGFHFRPGQLQMAQAVQEAFQQGTHLAVEGGTGVGKSLAYLLPALEEAWNNNKRVMISTWSISLQQQLVEKDLPRLEKVLERPISWVLAKGRGNYISRRRLRLWLESRPQLFDEEPLAPLLADWVENTQEGSLSDWSGPMNDEVWSQVVSDRDNCLGRKCPDYQSCFFYRARQELYHAQLVVVNHALFFSNLALGAEGFLPPCDLLIFDEAHHLEKTASEHLGFRITEGDFKRIYDRLVGRRNEGGLFKAVGITAYELVSDLRRLTQKLFRELRDCAGEAKTRRLLERPAVANLLNGPLTELTALLRISAENLDEDRALELKSQMLKITRMQVALNNFLTLTDPSFIYWLENRRSLQLVGAPVEAGQLMNQMIFSKPEPVCILTSATLSQAGSFEYMKERLGFEGKFLEVPSPFDYPNQMDLVLDRSLTDPQDDQYVSNLCDVLQHHLEQTLEGGIFILFTSQSVLLEVVAKIEPWLNARGRATLVQGRDGPDRRVLERFQELGKAVLFGTDRFWTGVDVPGEALQSVIITKLPFQPPNQPLTQARCERLEASGRSSFRELILPEAILRLRQGLGRLIRNQEDFGRVVILDGRMLSKSYGPLIRKSLPHLGRIWK